MGNVFAIMKKTGIVPVVVVQDPRKAVGLARAILRGGIDTLEITLRVDGAAECIAAIREAVPEMLVGAGTVLSSKQVEEALNAGAQYIVSPGYDEQIVGQCQGLGIPVIPGVTNATDIQKGLKAGLTVLKFFPSEPCGGTSAIGFLAAPFPMVQFLPAGGINFENLHLYMEMPQVLACAGGFVARAHHIEQEAWDAVTGLCQKAISITAKRLAR